MKNLNWTSIGLGVLIDIGLTLVLGTVLGIVMAAVEASQGVPLEKIGTQMSQNPAVLIFSLFIGLLATFVGAYVAAKHSASRETALQQAAIFGAISIGFGVLMNTMMSDEYPLWYNVLAYLLILPVALMGGQRRWRSLSRANSGLETSQSPFPEVPRR